MQLFHKGWKIFEMVQNEANSKHAQNEVDL